MCLFQLFFNEKKAIPHVVYNDESYTFNISGLKQREDIKYTQKL